MSQRIYNNTKLFRYRQVLKEVTDAVDIGDSYMRFVAEQLVATIKNLPESEALSLPVVPDSYRDHLLREVLTATSSRLKSVWIVRLRAAWLKMFSLGVTHSLTDIIYASGLFDFSKGLAKFTSIEGFSLLDKLPTYPNIALFEKNKLSIREQQAIDRAKRSHTILSRNMEVLRSNGYLYDEFDLKSSDDKVARMSLEQQLRFLSMIQEVDDRKKQAEASQYGFLGNQYLKDRQKVLADDYSKRYEDFVKYKISNYLYKNIEGVKQIRDTRARSEDLVNSIEKKLSAASPNKVVDAGRIVRTEMSLAYNFGKLAAYTGEKDRLRKFRWKTDWELQNMDLTKEYKICEYCMAMNNKEFTVEQLIKIGTVLDLGIMQYKKGTKTSFKNPALPMIPFHTNCVPAGVSVLCYDKEVNIENLCVGDMVYVPTTSKYEKITKVHKNWYEESLHKIRFSDGTECTYTTNHPIWTTKGWLDAGELRAGDTAFTYSKDVYSSMPSIQRVSKSEDGLSNTENVRTHCYKDIKTNEYTQNAHRSSDTAEQINKTQECCFGEDETEQPYVYAGSSSESTGQSLGKWFTGSPLQIKNRKRSLSNRVSRRYWSICKKLMGSERSQNTQETRHTVGIRKENRVVGWKTLLNGFLSSSLGCLSRSKGVLDRGCISEIQSISAGESTSEDSLDRESFLQGTNQEFQGLVPVRVVSVETYTEPQYVYNLTVENAEVYFANGILVHNCSCFWELVPEQEGEVLTPSSVAVPKPDAVDSALNTATLIAGTGLLVGGAFLLARSNLWNTFIKNAVATFIPKTIKPITVEAVTTVGKLIKEEAKETVEEEYARYLSVFLSQGVASNV